MNSYELTILNALDYKIRPDRKTNQDMNIPYSEHMVDIIDSLFQELGENTVIDERRVKNINDFFQTLPQEVRKSKRFTTTVENISKHFPRYLTERNDNLQ